MTELKDVLAKTSEADSGLRVARVISVDKHTLMVDLNSGAAGTSIQAVDSCNPRPDQNVLIAMHGNRPLAVGVVGGAYRQGTLVATADSTYHVTGLINGVSAQATKIGTFTAAVGNRYPLMWAENAEYVWVLPDPGSGFTPPDPGSGSGGGGSGGGGTPGSYTTSYAATSSGVALLGGSRDPGDLIFNFSIDYGYFQYGYGRFNELAGKTILSARIYLPRTSGSGNVTLQVNGAAGSSSTATGGWASLSLTRVNDLIGLPVIQMAEMRVTGTGSLRGVPAGTIQITWK